MGTVAATYEDIDALPAGIMLGAIVFLAASRALWNRRTTWRIPWEVAATLNVALQTAEIILISGPVSRWLGPKLHAATGIWNLEDLAGHLAYIIGMAAMAFTILSRLNMPDAALAQYIKHRIEFPLALFIPAVMMVFECAGFGDGRDVDLVLAHPTLWTRVYFLMYVGAVIYLLALVIPALLIIRRHQHQKPTATVYLCATGISGLCCVAIIVGIPVLVWVLIRAETAGYAIAASFAWSMRIRFLRGSRPRKLPRTGEQPWSPRTT